MIYFIVMAFIYFKVMTFIWQGQAVDSGHIEAVEVSISL